MDSRTDVHHVSRCPARAASLGHSRSRHIAVALVIGSPNPPRPLRYQQALRVKRPGNEEKSPTRNRSIDFFHRKFTTPWRTSGVGWVFCHLLAF